MYGHLNVIVRKFVLSKFGQKQWTAALKKSGCADEYNSHAVYDDDVTKKLINAAVAVTSLKSEAFLELLGEFYLEHVRSTGHDELLRNLGQNLLQFLENLDYVHTYMMSEFPDVNMPSFRCETDSQQDRMILHYYSFRQGYHPIVIGIIRAAAKIYFRSEIKVELISKETIEVADKKGKREHVVLSIMVLQASQTTHEDGPPTFVAQTKKHGEKQIFKQDVDHVMERLDQIRREEGEEGLPLNRQRATQAKWKSVAKMSVLYGGFVPQYPAQLSIDATSFCNAFPYHVTFNASMNVIHVGVKLQQLMPGIRTTGARLEMFFDLLHPHSVNFSFDNVKKFINTPFVLRTKATKMYKEWGKRPMVILRGQMVFLQGQEMVVYLCSPFVRCLGDLEQRRMYLADIPIHDVTRDMLWMELMMRYRSGGQHAMGAGPVAGKSTSAACPVAGFDNTNTGGMNDELARTQAALKAANNRNRMLYYSYLPPLTAQQILDGKSPDSGLFRDVTILFSDVVCFSNIVTKCKPHDVTNLLTSLQSKFRNVCMVHETYRVEVVGDAYMVVCGAPEQLATHAQRIANTALGMLIVARQIAAPLVYEDRTTTVKVRIGIHTGSVVCGVVGDVIPRFHVMGETVNMASKMESHGVADRIQISQTTHDKLKKCSFKMEKRGKIDIRGRGKTNTYFLLANDKCTDDEILGKKSRERNHEGVEVTFINEGHEEYPPRSTSTTGSRSPLLARNKVAPHDGDGTPASLQGSDRLVPMGYGDRLRHPLMVGANVRATGNTPDTPRDTTRATAQPVKGGKRK